MPDIVAYDTEQASAYRLHHRKNLRTRLTTVRERALVKRAFGVFAPALQVLDLACGTGRFWSVIEARAGTVVALDNSEAMLHEALAQAAPNLNRHVACGSVFRLPFADACFDVVVCMRLLHHFAHREDRMAALTEIRRITAHGAIVSLWTDGNAPGRRRLQQQRQLALPRGFGRRICIERTVIEEDFVAAGFGAATGYDLAPRVSMWRIYALRCDTTISAR